MKKENNHVSLIKVQKKILHLMWNDSLIDHFKWHLFNVWLEDEKRGISFRDESSEKELNTEIWQVINLMNSYKDCIDTRKKKRRFEAYLQGLIAINFDFLLLDLNLKNKYPIEFISYIIKNLENKLDIKVPREYLFLSYN